MARTLARLTDGSRITDYISLGVVAKTFPKASVEDVLKRTGRESARQRDLPAHVVVYYVIALALYMQASYREVLRCLLEGVQWLKPKRWNPRWPSSPASPRPGCAWAGNPCASSTTRSSNPSPPKPPKAPGTANGGWSASMAAHWTSLTKPRIARPSASTVASRGEAAFPQIRFVGPGGEWHPCDLWQPAWRPCEVGEATLAEGGHPLLKPGMLCLADRGFIGFPCGNWPRERAPTWSGGCERIWSFPGRRNCRTALPQHDAIRVSGAKASERKARQWNPRADRGIHLGRTPGRGTQLPLGDHHPGS